jgi:hypothetical protein
MLACLEEKINMNSKTVGPKFGMRIPRRAYTQFLLNPGRRYNARARRHACTTDVLMCILNCAGDSACSSGAAAPGEQYRSLKCVNQATSAFVSVDHCGEDQDLRFRNCSLPVCVLTKAVRSLEPTAWGPCSANCTDLFATEPPMQSR